MISPFRGEASNAKARQNKTSRSVSSKTKVFSSQWETSDVSSRLSRAFFNSRRTDDLRATCDQLTALRTFPQASGAFVSFPTPRPAGHFPQRRSRRSARSPACTVSHSPSSKTDGSHDGRSHPRRERGARGAHAPIGEICRESARSRRHAGVRRASPRRRRRRRERALPQSLAQAGYRPRGRRGACELPAAHPRKRQASCRSHLSAYPVCLALQGLGRARDARFA